MTDDLDWDEPDPDPPASQGEAFTDRDLLDLRDRLLAEIGRRLKDPRDAQKLTSTQLLAASKDLAKLTAGISATPEADGDLDLFALVERLPAEQRTRHLEAERVRLLERLALIGEALDE